MVEGERAVVVEDRHERLVEAALGDGGLGPVLAVDGERSHSSRLKPSTVAIRSAEMPWATMLYWSRRWWLLAVKPSTCSGAGRRHRLDAAADDEVLEAGEDAHGGEVHGLLARAAEAVERDAGRVERPAGVERGHAGDVHGVVAAAGAAAHHHVVDVGGVEAVAVLQGVEHLGQDPLRVDGVQRTRSPCPCPAASGRRR